MTPLRIIMLSYERAFLDARSEASLRLEKMTSEDVRISAIILSRAARGAHDRGFVRAIGLAGNPVSRFVAAFRAAMQEVKRARKAGETPLLSAQDPFVAGKIAFWVSRLLNVPYEIQEHADFFSGAWVRELPVIHSIMAWKGKCILRRADGVRVVSDRIRDRLVQRGVNADKIRVIPVAQDVSGLLTRTARAWPETPTIVVPCRFVKQKGLDVLIKALADLAKQGVAFRVRMIGEGTEGPKIAERASKLGIRDRITFEQWSAPEEIWNDANLFVLSSNYEGWGRTIVEAMAAGVPIVTTDVGCVGSLFRPQIDGRVVQPGDVKNLAAAIREQLTETERREWMVKNARERVKELPTREELVVRQRDVWRVVSGESRVDRRTWMITAAIIAFSVVVHATAVALFWHTLGTNREWGFFTLVQNWFQGYGYSFASQAGCVSAYRSPGFLFFLTAVYGLFGFANFFAQAVIQNALAVLLTYLVYRLGWRITNDRRVGWIAALLVTLHPYTFYHYTQYYHTVLSGTLLVSLLLCLFALERTKRWRWAIIAGVMVAGLAYIQGTILPTMPFLSLWLLWRWRKEWQRAIVAIGIIALTSAAVIAPWTIRNWNAFHQLVPLTTDLGHALAKANNENILALTILGFPQEVQTSDRLMDDAHPKQVKYVMRPEAEQALREHGMWKPSPLFDEWHPAEPGERWATCADIPISETAFNAYWSEYGTDWLKQNYWTDGWKLQLLKIAQFWSPSLQPGLKYGAQWSFASNPMLEAGARWSLTGYVALMELLAIMAVVVVVRRSWFVVRGRSDAPRTTHHARGVGFGQLIPFLIPMGIYTVMHSLFAGYTKYRIPLDNLLVILSAIALVALWDYFRRNRKV